jgi:hypothetical protein
VKKRSFFHSWQGCLLARLALLNPQGCFAFSSSLACAAPLNDDENFALASHHLIVTFFEPLAP